MHDLRNRKSTRLHFAKREKSERHILVRKWRRGKFLTKRRNLQREVQLHQKEHLFLSSTSKVILASRHTNQRNKSNRVMRRNRHDDEREYPVDSSWISYLIGIEPPKLEFFLEKRTTDVGRIMKFPCSVIVEYLSKDSWMSVEEIFIEEWIIISESFCQTR